MRHPSRRRRRSASGHHDGDPHGKRTGSNSGTASHAYLTHLARQPGRVFTRAQLLDAIRGADAEAFDRAIDAHVKNLRRKIERDPRRPRYLLTVHGVGYKFAE